MMQVMIEGMEDLTSSISNLAKKYPDEFTLLLEKEANSARTDVAKEARSALDTNTANKKSLGKKSNYKATPVRGYGDNQQIDITAESPHFHLLEHGHELVSHSGRSIGWVPGYLFMQATAEKYKTKFPTDAEELSNRILQGEGML